MNYFALDRAEGTHDVFLPDEELMTESHIKGIDPVHVRKILCEAARNKPIEFQLVGRDGIPLREPPQSPGDVVFWSWVPIFSGRSRELAVELGCAAEEFLQCWFSSNPGEVYFAHLPSVSYDVVDVKRSVFLITIPGNPPIPHHVKRLVMRSSHVHLPPCFRASVPQHTQVFGELFVSDIFVRRWRSSGMKGADFRSI